MTAFQSPRSESTPNSLLVEINSLYDDSFSFKKSPERQSSPDLVNEYRTLSKHLTVIEDSLKENNQRNTSAVLYSRHNEDYYQIGSTPPKQDLVEEVLLRPFSLVATSLQQAFRSNAVEDNPKAQNQPTVSLVQQFKENECSRDEEESRCGWLYFRPNCLQSKQTSKWVLFWLCWAGAVQGMVVNGFVNVCITTIEKRYHLKSADTGLIAGAYDIASVLCSIPVSYMGSLAGASKPRWLGWGILLMALGSFTFSLPHFIALMYKDSSNSIVDTADVLLCLSVKVNVTPHCQEKAENWMSSFRHIFAAGQFLHGIGAAPLYTLGITYLDESVPVKTSSIYLGIFYAMAIVGPAFGYVIGGQLLNVYIDAPQITASQLGVTPQSDQWLGAWWIGFLISGVLAIIIGWIIMAFPPEIPGSKTRRSQRIAEGLQMSTTQTFENLHDLPKASKILGRNLTFIFLSFAGATEGILLTGFATFMPKFIESQFSVSASSAALLVGLIAVPAGGGGTLIGGWLIKHFNLKCNGVLKVCTIMSVFCFLSCLSLVFYCPDTSFAGVTVPYAEGSLSVESNLGASCNAKCGCDNVPYDPVCGSDNILYYSPCHAGCNSSKQLHGNRVFENCECIERRLDLMNTTIESSALLEKCPTHCSMMPYFLLVFFLIMFITFIISMPAVSATLRCVPDTYRSLALGLQWILIRLLGTIPGPIIFGIIIDSTCRLWQMSCNVAGSCANYNNLSMSRSMMTLALVFKALSTLFFFLSWWFWGDGSLKRSTAIEMQQPKDPIHLIHRES